MTIFVDCLLHRRKFSKKSKNAPGRNRILTACLENIPDFPQVAEIRFDKAYPVDYNNSMQAAFPCLFVMSQNPDQDYV